MTQKTVISEAEFLEMIALHQRWVETSLQARRDATVQIEGAELGLADAAISNVELSGRNLQSAAFNRCTVSNVTFRDCDLFGAFLLHSVFDKCAFINCVLRKAQLNRSEFIACDFSDSNLTRAELFDTKMAYANLQNADLGWSRLFRTDLRYANLEGVDFTGAKLVNTKLYNDRKFSLKIVEPIAFKDVDTSPEGDGSRLVTTPEELLAFLAR